MEETEYCKPIVCRKTRKVLWSELVAELLGDIIGRLCVADRVRFRAVCKSWRDAKPINTTASTSTSTLPWFVSVGSTNRKRWWNQMPTRALECRLFDPSFSVDEPVSVHTISFNKLRIPVVYNGRNRLKTFCKQGWLFISITEKTGLSKSRIHFILFSPLTRKLKQLPSLLTASSDFEQTFSSDPGSADCVFLLLDASNYDSFTVTTCRKGDTQWTVRKFESTKGTSLYYSMPTYTRGLFYIISPFGLVVSYNVIEEKIKYETLNFDDDFAIEEDTHRRYKVFTRHGELMYNYRCINGTKRFDWSKKVWIPVSSLTDPPAARDKVTWVEDMIEFLDSKCLCSSESSSLADHLMFKPREYVFNTGSIKQGGTNSYFWLEPPLLH